MKCIFYFIPKRYRKLNYFKTNDIKIKFVSEMSKTYHPIFCMQNKIQQPSFNNIIHQTPSQYQHHNHVEPSRSLHLVHPFPIPHQNLVLPILAHNASFGGHELD